MIIPAAFARFLNPHSENLRIDTLVRPGTRDFVPRTEELERGTGSGDILFCRICRLITARRMIGASLLGNIAAIDETTLPRESHSLLWPVCLTCSGAGTVKTLAQTLHGNPWLTVVV